MRCSYIYHGVFVTASVYHKIHVFFYFPQSPLISTYNNMEQPIVITAFGTTTKAQETYKNLHRRLEKLLPDRDIFWAYSSKMITRTLQDKGAAIQSPEELLLSLAKKNYKAATVQSLHLFPGTEFHELQKITAKSPLSCTSGLPLLTSPTDYNELANLLGPTITKRSEATILVLGHGTSHPSWTGYYSLEKILQKKFSKGIHVGVVEHFPDSSDLIDEIAKSGTDKVTIIPLFLICGMHYRRDIIAEDSSSWVSRLQKKGVDVEVLDTGIGQLPGIENILARHITEAENTLSS